MFINRCLDTVKMLSDTDTLTISSNPCFELVTESLNIVSSTKLCGMVASVVKFFNVVAVVIKVVVKPSVLCSRETADWL